MKAIKEVLIENLISLRKEHKLTQLELAEKIGYSDKAVSRWEHGEVLPDVETLDKIAGIYGIPLSALLEEHDGGLKKTPVSSNRNHIVITSLAMTLVWFIAVFVYVILFLKTGKNIWQVFILAVTASAIVALVFSAIWSKAKRKTLISVFCSVIVWSVLIFIHVSFGNYRLWPVYFLGIPLQIAIFLIFGFKRKKKIV
mgnify:FL=1